MAAIDSDQPFSGWLSDMGFDHTTLSGAQLDGLLQLYLDEPIVEPDAPPNA